VAEAITRYSFWHTNPASKEMEDIMARKKNSFWNFVISCMPGAGQMYQGFLKRGTSLMVLFFGGIFLANMVNIDWILFGSIVIWFYSFFDSLNSNGLSDEEFNKLEDGFLFTDNSESFKFSKSKFRIPLAVVLIMAGCYILLENILYMFRYTFGFSYDWWVMDIFFDYFPRFVFAAAVIIAGLYLIRGKKSQFYDEFEYSDIDDDDDDL